MLDFSEPVSRLVGEGLLSEHNPFTSLPSHTSPPTLMSQGPLAFHNKSLSNLSVCETFVWQREAACVCVCVSCPLQLPHLRVPLSILTCQVSLTSVQMSRFFCVSVYVNVFCPTLTVCYRSAFFIFLQNISV